MLAMIALVLASVAAIDAMLLWKEVRRLRYQLEEALRVWHYNPASMQKPCQHAQSPKIPAERP